MESRLKIIATIVGLTFGLSGCVVEGLDGVKHTYGVANPASVGAGDGMAIKPDASKSKPTQLAVPDDKKVAAAMNEALPNIKKVLGIHQCIKNYESIRQLNTYALNGVDLTTNNYYGFPDSNAWMKYHDLNKCVSVRAIDNWSMPALNALFFRAVYFADDSGETVSFLYLFKKTDGSWQIAQIEKAR